MNLIIQAVVYFIYALNVEYGNILKNSIALVILTPNTRFLLGFIVIYPKTQNELYCNLLHSFLLRPKCSLRGSWSWPLKHVFFQALQYYYQIHFKDYNATWCIASF